MSADETLEEWAALRAHQLDAEGWRWTNSDKYCDEWLEAVSPYPVGATVVELKGALRAYRDSVAAGLSSDAIRAIRDGMLPVGEGRDLRLVDDDGWTDFGHEIARVFGAKVTP